ncbi:MAG: cyanophycinase [Planctomycetota bacterium]|nr:cyanophycinase [Planctomycetota bacterium]
MRKTASILAGVLTLTALAGPASANGWICAEGGGAPTPNGWGASVFGWMVQKGGGGPVVILGTSGSDAAAANAFLALGASSATNLAVTAANANSPAVQSQIASASVVWIRGGDQWQYISTWRGTLAEQAIRSVYANGGVVGGTSAGCAILGDLIYDARNGSVFPYETLANPYNTYTTFTADFLQLQDGVIFDTHFTERARLGRLPVFVSRLWKDSGLDLIGVGVDDSTALCIDPNGLAEVRGEGAVTIVHRTGATRQLLIAGQPPAITGLAHVQLTEGYVYDLSTRTVVARPANATLAPAPGADPSFTATSLAGNLAGDANRGDLSTNDGGNSLALFQGALQVIDGTNELLSTVVATRVWNDTTFDENRMGGAQLLLAQNPAWLALYLDNPTRVSTTSAGFVNVDPASGTESSLVVLDARGVVSTAQSTYVSSGGSAGPRQSVALEGATLSLLRRGMAYDAVAHASRWAAPFGQGKVNSLGRRAFLESAGTPSPSSNDFAITVRDGVPGVGALLFFGPNEASTPFQGGTLYVGGSITRVGIQFLDGTGSRTWLLPVAPNLTGTRRTYQAWYRNGALNDGFNTALSNALRVLHAE